MREREAEARLRVLVRLVVNMLTVVRRFVVPNLTLRSEGWQKHLPLDIPRFISRYSFSTDENKKIREV